MNQNIVTFQVNLGELMQQAGILPQSERTAAESEETCRCLKCCMDRLPFEPKSLGENVALHDAQPTRVYSIDEIRQVECAPEQARQHIFDFANGVRAFVYRPHLVLCEGLAFRFWFHARADAALSLERAAELQNLGDEIIAGFGAPGKPSKLELNRNSYDVFYRILPPTPGIAV